MRHRFLFFLLGSLAAATLVAGCSSGAGAGKAVLPPDVIPPDAETIQRIEAAASADELVFQTAETVDGLSYGLLGDGATDNTAAFQNLLSTGNRTIHIPAGDYVTGKLNIPSNTILVLEPGVIIRDSGLLGSHDRLINIRGENIRIEGHGASIVAQRSGYASGEQRHGVYIFGSQRVVIEGLESSGHGGDGFYIGGPSGSPSADIYLRGCRAANNRRQGLSITSARRVRISDCEFTDTSGTAPQFGVDLEPNDTADFMDDIVLLRPYTHSNQGGGILIHLARLDGSSHSVNVSIVEHASVSESPTLNTHVPQGVRAILRYSRQN
jgi:Right handed beta helix region